MTAIRPNRLLLLALLLVVAVGRWVPMHSHIAAEHEHDGAQHEHPAEFHAHQALARHADAFDLGHVPSHEFAAIELYQEQSARVVATPADSAAAPPAAIPSRAIQRSRERTFPPDSAPHRSLGPPPHRGEPRAPPLTA